MTAKKKRAKTVFRYNFYNGYVLDLPDGFKLKLLQGTEMALLTTQVKRKPHEGVNSLYPGFTMIPRFGASVKIVDKYSYGGFVIDVTLDDRTWMLNGEHVLTMTNAWGVRIDAEKHCKIN